MHLTTEKYGKYDAKLTHIFHEQQVLRHVFHHNIIFMYHRHEYMYNTHEYCRISFCVIHVVPLSEFLIYYMHERIYIHVYVQAHRYMYACSNNTDGTPSLVPRPYKAWHVLTMR